ncbi:MAG: DevR family CRISPR-associated autoregulator [Anaerolineales bacterium]|nr:DevR family CRISPR-associated autoregulator [Anaerolineales bacterium]
MSKNVYSLSISAQATLDMHSLNNEGGEGNQITTRMVNIVGEDRRLYNVNAISGDMLKHIQAEHLFKLLSSRGAAPLCAGCRGFNANRISADESYGKAIEGKSDAEAISLLLGTCALDDLAGNLITAGNRSIPRKSVAEFSWVIGLPDLTTTDSYFHVKYANERSKAVRDADQAEGARGANLGQAIFHRPASSGVYAIVANFETARIGFNDITQTYAVDEAQRKARHQALLESILYTFIEPNGAMRGTQNPHIVDLQGVLTVSSEVVPAPTLSPINSHYREQLLGVREALEEVCPGAVTLHEFDTLAQFSHVMTGLIQTTVPYTLHYCTEGQCG